MTEKKHTPGPWTIHNHPGSNGYRDNGHCDGDYKSEILAGSDLIYVRQSVSGNTFPKLSANVQLIATAPEMLLELERGVHLISQYSPNDPILSAWLPGARAAISKAKGEDHE